jgi:type I restriction enzyme S subunit
MSVVGKAGYQETDAGWIPADWSALALGSVASVRKGKGIAKQGLPCIELEHIEPKTGRLLGWDDSGVQASIKTAFSKGDVLFGKLRPYLRKYAVAPFDGISTTEILAIYPKEKATDRCFLFHLMQGDGVFSTVEALSYGTKMPRVSWTDLSNIAVGIPPLPEQQKIAAILTAVDDKLDVIARQIEAVQTLKQGLMQTLFSRGVGTQDSNGRWVPHTEFNDSELGEIPAGWEVGSVGSYVSALRSGVSVNAEDRECEIDEIGVLKVSSVQGGIFIPSNHKTVLTEEKERVAEPVLGGRIIISRANTPALVGESAYVETPHPTLFLPDKLWQTEPSDRPHSVKWLGFYLQCPFVRQEISKAATGTSGSMKNIAKPAFLSIPMPLIPLGEQERIAEILSAVTSKVGNLRNQQTHYQTLKSGLMQKLLTGEWRVTLDVEAEAA